ncbi:hypothetical protein [Winogradskyella thalassocola]|uniref:Type I restriction enzyme, S subunit n=1 Tax=Winogradskyella thalassocola TaxID=262004 RepID=A0A1G7ZMW8_9FLAO|nr:hypothetical protein [Winogradskyella thalassocola]SDH10111.1 hypothetical protein SAMN04489796_1011386 [Winogradskyella thalassocola]
MDLILGNYQDNIKCDSIYLITAKRISETTKQSQKLSELRDWFLPMLMNGKVTVGEAQQELGMVAEESEKYN